MRKKHITKLAAFMLVIALAIVIIRNLYLFMPGTHYYRDNSEFALMVIYMALFTIWGSSIRQRIIQDQTRQLFVMVSFMEMLWILGKMIHSFIEWRSELSLYFWYASMIPILVMPSLMMLASFSMDKDKKYRLKKGMAATVIVPDLCMIILVMTNNLHQLVFEIYANSDGALDIDYNLGVYVEVAWVFACMLGFLAVLFKKFKRQKSGKSLWLMLVPMAFGFAYAMILIMPWTLPREIYSGNVYFISLFYCALIECCIFCGLIDTNSGYVDIFEKGTIGERITDKKLHTVYVSDNAIDLSVNQIYQAIRGGLNIGDKYMVNAVAISGGYGIWHEDIRRITGIIKEFKKNQNELEEMVHIQRENFETRKKISSSREKNRLYDEFMHQISDKAEELGCLIEEYENCENPAYRKKLLTRMCIIGTYIKRRGNMTYIRDMEDTLDIYELSLSLEETLLNLKLVGIECGIDAVNHGRVHYSDVMKCYEKTEELLETEMENIGCVWLKLREKQEEFVVHLEIERLTAADNIETISFPVRKAGGVL